MESNWAERTIVVSGFPEDILPSIVMIDKLTIHFLRPRNGGGEVESVIYPADATGIAYVTFEKEEVMDSVLRKKEQVLEDKQLPTKYPLTISHNRVDVFTQVSVDLNLSIFGERLVRELESNNKSLHFSLWPDGRLHVEGSFAAIKELRKDLQRRVGEPQVLLQSSVLTTGVNASEKKLVKPASNVATQMTEPQKLAASLSYGANYALHPGVFEEETTIILDADIFMYIKEFCQEQCEEILQKNYVRALVTNSDCITVLQLEKASDRCEPSQLMTAKFGIEVIISQMQQSLVSEKIRLDGGRGQNKTLEICKETMKRFPEVLFRSTDEYFILIGNSNHCSLFKKEVEEKVKAVQLVFDPAFSGHSGNLNATGRSYHFDQSLGSNTVHGCYEPNTSEYSLNRESHSGQYTKSQADCLQTSYSSSDSYRKLGSSHCGVDALISGQSSLPASLSTGSGTRRDRQSENTAGSERSLSSRQCHF